MYTCHTLSAHLTRGRNIVHRAMWFCLLPSWCFRPDRDITTLVVYRSESVTIERPHPYLLITIKLHCFYKLTIQHDVHQTIFHKSFVMVTSSVIGAVILQCYSTNAAMETAVSMHIQGVMDTSLYACRYKTLYLQFVSVHQQHTQALWPCR